MRTTLAAFAVLFAGLGAPVALVSGPADATVSQVGIATVHHHKCTRTSSGHCIAGGQFCPQAKYGKSGWDAKGRRYVCKGNRTHPHWMKP